ncbi:hypothetical protein [Pedobacter frigoris]|uniref:Uncharacterized protein n=1 Tax=Pedobacter frigoris TaxID=2571272 RepID=A0A4U1CMA7_9SPHI|nr:hypothetical protein [Pedobacter frigoris]TKC08991.1 hypothetical protein FA047_02530 [Pedobacter frigoris]
MVVEDSDKIDINDIVKKEILNKSIDLTTDYTEIALDALLTDGILREVPMVKSLLSFYDVTRSVIDRHKINKILAFFKEFHSGSILEDKFEAFKIKFNQDKKYQRHVLETIILYNERFLHILKSRILANLLKAHIEQLISKDEFDDIAVVLDILHPKGIEELNKFYPLNGKWHQFLSTSWKARYEGTLLMSAGIAGTHSGTFLITPLGQQLYEFGIKPLNMGV